MKIKATVLAISATIGASFAAATPALAQPDPYIGQIMYFGGDFCPRGWVQANGGLLAVASNSALFSVLGTNFGGDGMNTFAVPDLRGRSAVGVGAGPGLTIRQIGQKAGTETNTLTIAQMPAHNHTATMRAADTAATSDNPTGNLLADFPPAQKVYAPGPANTTMSAESVVIAPNGMSQPVNNMAPFTVIMPCIATVGIYPSRG